MSGPVDPPSLDSSASRDSYASVDDAFVTTRSSRGQSGDVDTISLPPTDRPLPEPSFHGDSYGHDENNAFYSSRDGDVSARITMPFVETPTDGAVVAFPAVPGVPLPSAYSITIEPSRRVARVDGGVQAGGTEYPARRASLADQRLISDDTPADDAPQHSTYDQHYSEGYEYNYGYTGDGYTTYETGQEYEAGLIPAGDSDEVPDIFSLSRHGKVEEVKALLERGVPVNLRDPYGNTILAIACQNGRKRIAKLALRKGADINARNVSVCRNKWCPPRVAVHFFRLVCSQHRGNTPLHFCYQYGYGESLGEYLLEKGADDSIRNEDGLLCYDLAPR
jgi:hypothetical protein